MFLLIMMWAFWLTSGFSFFTFLTIVIHGPCSLCLSSRTFCLIFRCGGSTLLEVATNADSPCLWLRQVSTIQCSHHLQDKWKYWMYLKQIKHNMWHDICDMIYVSAIKYRFKNLFLHGQEFIYLSWSSEHWKKTSVYINTIFCKKKLNTYLPVYTLKFLAQETKD